MRYSADHKEQTRQRILEAAARVFRREGFKAAGVEAIMAEAGLTVGGFYAHFRSKDDLFAAAFADALERIQERDHEQDQECPRTERVQRKAFRYLSPTHRKAVEQGCPLPPLLAELPRQNAEIRKSFEASLRAMAADLNGGPLNEESPDELLGIVATMVGGIALARAVESPKLADQILASCRRLVQAGLKAAEAQQ